MNGTEVLRSGTIVRRLAVVCGGTALLLWGLGCGGAHVQPGQINSAKASMKAEAASARQVLANLKVDLTNKEQAIPEIININYASQKKLATLPGITMTQAREIMDNRPYNTPEDLLYKHVVTQAEFQLIKGRVDAWDNLWATKD